MNRWYGEEKGCIRNSLRNTSEKLDISIINRFKLNSSLV